MPYLQSICIWKVFSNIVLGEGGKQEFVEIQLNQQAYWKKKHFNSPVALHSFFEYRKNSIERPGGIHFFKSHNFWITCHITTIKAYSDRKWSTLSEYAFILVLSCLVQKLRVEKCGYPLVYLSRFDGNTKIFKWCWNHFRKALILFYI